MQTIYCYTDYRSFLRDAYAEAKQRNPVFSYRYFAKKAGFASPNFLKLVIDGQRNLSHDSMPRFAEVFQLKRRERRFFELLVNFNQSTTPEEQSHYYQQLLEFPEYCNAQELAQEQYEYLSHWFYPVIEELTTLPDFEEDADWIAKRLRRKVTPAQARDALACLQRLGLLVRDDDGLLKPSKQHFTTGDETRSAAVFSYHQQMMERAKIALRTQKGKEREYAALTIGVNPSQLKLLKHAIRDFRKVVLNLAAAGSDGPTAVYQLNLQLFGHTAFVEKKERHQ